MEAYFAPRMAARTNRQVQISITSLPELSGAGGGGITQELPNLLGEGTLDMANIYSGYVPGALPAIEVQSVWGIRPDWENTYLALADMVPDIERILTEDTGGPMVNRNWFAGAEQWFFSKEPLQTVDDFQGKRICQEIIIEEEARAELEALRIARYHNILVVQANQAAGIHRIPFSEDIIRYVAGVVLPRNFIPDWVDRQGYQEHSQEAVRVFNEFASQHIWLRIDERGAVSPTYITKGPRAT